MPAAEPVDGAPPAIAHRVGSTARMGVVVAAFDVDGTLTVRDCVVPFLARMSGGRAQLARRLARHPVGLLAAAARRDRDAMKAAATQAALAGLRADRVADEAHAYAGMIATSWLRPDTAARLAWHRSAGHRVVLVSASYEVYVGPLAARLEVDAVATRLVVAPDGTLTGALDGPNCRGAEKLVRLRAWQAAVGVEGAELWAYGDSAGDDELLAAADHPVRVGDEPMAPAP
jgi:phosphatidylglycerophosphatase C